MYGVFEAQPSASDSDSSCRKGVGEFFGGGVFSIVQVPLTFFGRRPYLAFSVLSLTSRISQGVPHCRLS